ncbi:MAG: zinc ribbon domain-containing protein [Clostridia bacterium]|nr:zinc ribbon domain-containing protein [Clostridia bacterium]
MSYCIKCEKEIEKGAAFCTECGAPVEKETSANPEQNKVPVQSPTFNEEFDREEREFLDNTHKLLRWELKAWSIASKVSIIMGIVYAVVFSIYTIVGIAMFASDYFLGGFFIGFGTTAAILGGVMFIGIGIVSRKAAERIPQYIDTVYTDFSISYKRCGNIGMLIFNVVLGVVSPIFFIINFVRMKANRNVIERILKNQNVQG